MFANLLRLSYASGVCCQLVNLSPLKLLEQGFEERDCLLELYRGLDA